MRFATVVVRTKRKSSLHFILLFTLQMVLLIFTAYFQYSYAEECDDIIKEEIIYIYTSSYHDKWNEFSLRNQVDAVVSETAADMLADVPAWQLGTCSFSEIVERKAPVTSKLGPKLSQAARPKNAILEFASYDGYFCLGLNNEYDRHFSEDAKYPYLKLQLPKEQFFLSYIHYAMKCFDKDGYNGRYIHYINR